MRTATRLICLLTLARTVPRTLPCGQWRTSIFFFNATATTEIYTLSLHAALPIFGQRQNALAIPNAALRTQRDVASAAQVLGDRKSTRLNSSHGSISYAFFCL